MGEDLLKVGIADMKVATKEEGIITFALGSCIGVCLYDPGSKIAGMVHIMLPEPGGRGDVDNDAKYATTGIPELIKKMTAAGAVKSRLVAKIAGGAKMFNMVNMKNIGDIGMRNAETVRNMLSQERIRLLKEDCGQDYARTMTFYRETGDAKITSYGHPEKML
ncbi:MAG: chemotaxis protein CheD [Anaerovoracaceae bacterium]